MWKPSKSLTGHCCSHCIRQREGMREGNKDREIQRKSSTAWSWSLCCSSYAWAEQSVYRIVNGQRSCIKCSQCIFFPMWETDHAHIKTVRKNKWQHLHILALRLPLLLKAYTSARQRWIQIMRLIVINIFKFSDKFKSSLSRTFVLQVLLYEGKGNNIWFSNT